MPVLLDTNVASEILKPMHRRNSDLWAWFESRKKSAIRLCRIVDAEVRFGAYAHRDEVQGERILRGWEALLSAFPVLEYCSKAADGMARLRAGERRVGRQISFADAAIAGIALANGCALATRNVKDFEGADLPVVNPFEPSEEGQR